MGLTAFLGRLRCSVFQDKMAIAKCVPRQAAAHWISHDRLFKPNGNDDASDDTMCHGYCEGTRGSGRFVSQGRPQCVLFPLLATSRLAGGCVICAGNGDRSLTHSNCISTSSMIHSAIVLRISWPFGCWPGPSFGYSEPLRALPSRGVFRGPRDKLRSADDSPFPYLDTQMNPF